MSVLFCANPAAGRFARRLLVAVAMLAQSAIAWGQRPDDKVTLNFANADLESVIQAMGEISGRNILVDPRVKGTINVITPGPVTRAQAYEIFLSALRVLGFTAVEGGGITTILPETDAKLRALPVTPSGEPRERGDRLVTQVFALRNESAAQLIPVLRPLIAPNNTIVAHASNNSLVITDYAENLRRIGRIIAALDNPGSGDLPVIEVKHASAIDIAQTVSRLLAGDGPVEPSLRVTLVADPRTNTILLRGDSPSRVERAKALALALDRPTSIAGNIHVVYLKNAEAAKVAETLRAILSGVSTAPVAVGAGGAAAAGGGGLSANIIQADPTTNALIITASDVVYNSLRGVIEKLDIRRAQVFVEALIAEVSADKAAEFGIQWTGIHNITPQDTASRTFSNTNFGGAGQNILGVAQNPTTVGRGLNVGIVRGQVTISGIGTITNLGLLARALETHAKANILSTPNILTMDNEEARIVIGQNVPFITGQYAQTGTTATATTPVPFQTIERRDVGLSLRVRPQISEGGAIKLRLYQEVSTVQDRTNASGIITNKRSIESTVVVDDGLIVAIGGLIEDRLDDGKEQVPLLGDLPLIGHLFRYENRRQVKTNLMVFLRPVILREARSSESITQDRYHMLLDEQRATIPAQRLVLPDMIPPHLPQMKPPADATGLPLPLPLRREQPTPPPAAPASR